MFSQRFHQLIADRERRIERGHRVLKDHRDPVAPQGAHLFLALSVRRSFPSKRTSPLDHSRRRRQESHQREPDRRLAAARLADEPDDLARRDLERDAIDRPDRVASGQVVRRQIADTEEVIVYDQCVRGEGPCRPPSPYWATASASGLRRDPTGAVAAGDRCSPGRWDACSIIIVGASTSRPPGIVARRIGEVGQFAGGDRAFAVFVEGGVGGGVGCRGRWPLRRRSPRPGRTRRRWRSVR